jgi:hypothetical protein
LIFQGIKKDLTHSEAFFDQLEGDKKVNSDIPETVSLGMPIRMHCERVEESQTL